MACFSQDAVLLANFLRLGPGDSAVDLGAGNGVVSILGQAKTGAAFAGVEKQPALCELARRSAALNGQSIPFHCMDVADAPHALGCGAFTAAVLNPPYFSAGDLSQNASRADARHGADTLLHDFLLAASLLVKNGGRVFVCYPAAQLVDLLCALRAARLEPKRMRLAMVNAAGAPTRVLAEAKKNARPGLVLEPA